MAEVGLHIVDYLVFAATLVACLGIGIYHSLTGGKQKTSGEYLLGNRKMTLIPVSMSLMVSYISTNSLMGFPAEMYSFGTQYWLGLFGSSLGVFIGITLFVPMLYPLKMTSVNEVGFFKKNLSNSSRKCCSLFY